MSLVFAAAAFLVFAQADVAATPETPPPETPAVTEVAEPTPPVTPVVAEVAPPVVAETPAPEAKPEKLYCETITNTGSRLGKKKRCETQKQRDARMKDEQDKVRRMQSGPGGKMTAADGH